MSTKSYFFLSGIARSGSTLLGSILNQNPEIHVSPTSPLLDLYCLTEESLQKLNQQYTFDLPSVSPSIHSSLHTSFYSNIPKKYILDKHRGWPRNINTIKQIITPTPKVVCTYRPAAENVVSFLKLMNKDPNNFVDKDLMSSGLQLNTHNRAMCIWNNYSADPYYSLKHGLENNRDCIHLVHYNDLIATPASTLNKVYDFLEIPSSYDHDFNYVNNTCREQDDKWGMQDLHTIRPSLSKTSDDPLEVLGQELFDYFSQFDKQLSL